METPVFPDDARYTAEHEWARVLTGSTTTIRIGITDFAQEALGDIVFITLPEVGAEVAAGQAFGEVESTKSVSDIYAPVAGVVVSRNEALDRQPELLNSDPYGEGWIVDIELGADSDAASVLAGLLSAADYQALVGA
jgi:glycine cleavage system H protein